MKRGLQLLGLLTLAMTASCSQSRRPLSSAGSMMSEIKTLKCYDQESDSEFECFQMRLDYQRNIAYFKAIYLPHQYEGRDVPYRILAKSRLAGQQEWEVMAENVFHGDMVVARPSSGKIADYEEWVIETMQNFNAHKTDWVFVSEFAGIIIFDQIVTFNDQNGSRKNSLDPFSLQTR